MSRQFNLFGSGRTYIKGVVLLFLAVFVYAAQGNLQDFIADLQSQDTFKKINAIQSIKSFRQPEAARALSSALSRENDPMAQMALLDGLASMPELAAAGPVAPLLSSSLVPMRKRAAYTLGLIGGRRAERALSQALSREADPEVKAMLLQSLSVCASSESVETLERARRDSRPEVRAKAEEALDHLPGYRPRRVKKAK